MSHRRELRLVTQSEKGFVNQRKIILPQSKSVTHWLNHWKDKQTGGEPKRHTACLSWYKGEHKPHQNVRTCPFCLVLRSDGVSCKRGRYQIRGREGARAHTVLADSGCPLSAKSTWDWLVVVSSSEFSAGSLMCSHQQEQRQNLASDADARTFPNGFDADYWDSKTA